MNTLREIGEFIGMSPGTRLRSASDLVISPGEQISMREVIRRLPNLPPISLEAEAENTAGEVPFRGIIHVHSSTGVVLETHVGLFRNGQLVGAIIKDTGAPATDKGFEVVDPGNYVLEVTRTGITGTGITTLRKTFDIFARAKPEPPPPPPPPPPPLKEPTISATTEGAGAGTVLVVSGSGFLPILPNRIVTVRVTDDQLNPERNFQQSSTPEGKLINMRISLPCNSGFSFHVSATDSRPGPGPLGVVFSNTVKLLCP